MEIPQFLCAKQAMAEVESEIAQSRKNYGTGNVRGKGKGKRKPTEWKPETIEQRRKKQREQDESDLAAIEAIEDPVEKAKEMKQFNF